MAVRKETVTVNEKRTVAVTKNVGVTYASDVSNRKLKVRKSQRSNGKFVVSIDNAGEKSIVVSKTQLAKFLHDAQDFVASV